MGCGMCTTKCTFGILEKQAPKIPPFVHPHKAFAGKLTSENTETTRVMINESACVGCGHCSTACNFGAITVVNYNDDIFAAKAAGKKLIAMIAPATRIGVAEAMGMPAGTTALSQLIVGLRKIGFDYVFDINSAADKTTIDDLAEVVALKKAGKGPAITSCCPGWLECLEKDYPELIPQVSTARSPTACLCGLVKHVWAKEQGLKPEDVYTVGIMPCVAKKVEAFRGNLHQDWDSSMTSQEVAELIKQKTTDKFTVEREAELAKTEEGKCDLPFRAISGGSNIFAKTAGVTETVLRVIAKSNGEVFDPKTVKAEVIFEHPSGSKLTILTFPSGGVEYKAAVAHGGFSIRKACEMMLEKKLEVDVVEMMACLGGCQNGAGQPKLPMQKPKADEVKTKRTEILDKLDQETEFLVATENTEVLGYIDKHLDEHQQHEFLHTSYAKRYN